MKRIEVDMKLLKADLTYTDSIYELVQDTIIKVYPKYYESEIVQFFCDFHSKENIVSDIGNGNVYVLISENEIVGTGTVCDNHLTRIFVKCDEQNKGYGTFILNELESKITDKHDTVYLDTSIGAKDLYVKRGFRVIKKECYPVKKDIMLNYEVMEKKLK